MHAYTGIVGFLSLRKWAISSSLCQVFYGVLDRVPHDLEGEKIGHIIDWGSPRNFVQFAS